MRRFGKMKRLNLQRFKYPDDIDKELVPFLDAANSIPGLRTMYCCSGHGNSMFYVMFACCNETVASRIFKLFRIPIPKQLEFEPGYSKNDIRERTVASKDNKFSAVLDDPEILRYRGFCPQETISITIYSKWLGTMKSKDRRLELSKLRKNILEFVPKKHW